MSAQKYAFEGYHEDKMARAVGRSLPISAKQSVEVCSYIRGRKVESAKVVLKNVIEKKLPVPYKRYNRSMGHKKGDISVGRYPVKTSKNILSIIESAEANAQFKGLNTSNLRIAHICAHKGSSQWHYGRQRRRQMKRTHIEVVVAEGAEEKSKISKKPSSAKEDLKKKDTYKKQNASKEKKEEEKSNDSKPGTEKETKNPEVKK